MKVLLASLTCSAKLIPLVRVLGPVTPLGSLIMLGPLTPLAAVLRVGSVVIGSRAVES